MTGLKNLGNTCYMNSILQCLSNTVQLTEYCISDKYKEYISRGNSRTNGQVIEEVAALIKELWNGQYKCVASSDLRVGLHELLLYSLCFLMFLRLLFAFRKLLGNFNRSLAALISRTLTNSSPF